MKKVLAALLFVLAISAVQARLSETLDECKASYGAVKGQIAPDQFAFALGHVTIIVHFRDGRSIQEDFLPESGAALSEAEITEFLQESSEGSTWKISMETPSIIFYSRKDGRATAQQGKPITSNTNGSNVKLTLAGAELIIKYTDTAGASHPGLR